MVGGVSQGIGLGFVDEYNNDAPAKAVKALVGITLPFAPMFTGPAGAGLNAAVNLGWATVDAVQAAAWEVIANAE